MATTKPQKAAYGTWKSPVTAEVLTDASVILESVLIDEVTREIYHIERRASEGGRSVLVNSKVNKDVVGNTWNVRTGVHEYGGGPAAISNGLAYFSHYKDGRVYRTQDGKTPEPVTPENTNWRYADFVVLRTNPNILVSVFEDHTKPDPSTVVNKLVSIDTSSQSVQTLAEGADFYSSPRISPDGNRIAWIQWCHPDMPWEGSELYVAEIVRSGTSITLNKPKAIAGRKGEISVDQPQWASNDTLIFLNDVSGYVNPWSYSSSSSQARPLASEPLAGDFAEPAWTLGRSAYAIFDANTVLFAPTRDGRSTLSIADLQSRSFKPISVPYVDISSLRAVSGSEAVLIGKNEDDAGGIVQINFNASTEPTFAVIKGKSNLSLPKEIISKGRSYSLPVPPSNELVHVVFYPPFNPAFAPLDGEAPPAVISIHGGPTSRALPGLDWAKQFWTSRGWAWVDVNYGGSSGYGRQYRERLRGNWGIVDVHDSAEAAKQLSERGLIDPKRTAIRGSSAGGYTVLASIVNRPEMFAAAASLYGISDLVKLGEDTHKFESCYLKKLVGGSPEEVPEVYKDRSPVTHADKIEAPLLILQGSIDKVVLPSQAEEILKCIRRKSGRVQYILFEGEGHGWRKAENIKRGLEAELAWYEDVFGLTKKRAAAL